MIAATTARIERATSSSMRENPLVVVFIMMMNDVRVASKALSW
jgi:hypothetical protein